MKELREHIKEHKDQLYQLKAAEAGHKERFKKKLNSNDGKGFFNRQNPLWLYAAAASLLVLIGTFVWQWSSESAPRPIELSEVSPEYERMESYFKEKIHHTNAVVEASSDSLIQRYLVDLQELSEEHKRLEIIHGRDPGNELVVNALIKNYKSRLRILESLKRYAQLKKQHSDEFNNI